MRATGGAEQSALARDAFSLLHFPMICGVIAYAVAVEEALAHPDEPLSLVVRLALAVGLLLFIGGMAVAIWRATGRLLWPRLVLVVATAGGIVAVHARPLVSLAIALIGTVTVAVLEQRADSPVVDVPE